MLTAVVQRWRERCGVYRPAGEVIDPRHYEVAPIPDDRTARVFVEQHHYLASYPPARFRFGLYWGGLLVGVAVFSHPMQERIFEPFWPLEVLNGPLRPDSTFTARGRGNLVVLPGDPLESVELGRLVLLDRVPANAESWFVARCFELLRAAGITGVISFSDPFPREAADGRRVFVGHIGTVYQATNAVYAGRGSVRTKRLLPDGTVLGDRAIAKIRGGERGHRYAEELLQRHGAPRLRGDPRAWLTTWLPRLTRTVRHTGNHRYLFGLAREVRERLPRGLPYPKFDPQFRLKTAA